MFDWYQIFSLTEFLASGLVSKNLTVFLEGIGEKSILVTHGNELGVTIDDTFLILGFNGQNPYTRGQYAVFTDEAENVWLGKAVS